MFNWMNRRFYHFLKMWLSILGIMVGFAIFIALFMLFLSYIESIWGGKGVFVSVFGLIIFALSVAMSWWASDHLYKKELEEQRRCEKSLKKDWTK